MGRRPLYLLAIVALALLLSAFPGVLTENRAASAQELAAEPSLVIEPYTVVPREIRETDARGNRMEEIAPGQPIYLRMSYRGLGPGTHEVVVRLRDQTYENGTREAIFPVTGDSGVKSVEIDWGILPKSGFAPGNTLLVEAETNDSNGRTVRSSCRGGESPRCTFIKRETTLYVDVELNDLETDRRYPEREVTRGELIGPIVYYGWSKAPEVSIRVVTNGGNLSNVQDDTVILPNLRPLSRRAYELWGATDRFAPTKFDDRSAFFIGLRPESGSWGTKGSLMRISVNEAPRIRSVTINGRHLTDKFRYGTGEQLVFDVAFEDRDDDQHRCIWSLNGETVYNGSCDGNVTRTFRSEGLLYSEVYTVQVEVDDGHGGLDLESGPLVVRNIPVRTTIRYFLLPLLASVISGAVGVALGKRIGRR